MLPTVVPEPFDSPDHIFEVRWAGVRAIAVVDGGKVRLHGRNLRDLTPLYPELASLAGCLRAGQAVVDGEIIAWGSEEVPVFDLQRPRLLRAAAEAPAVRGDLRVTYQVFDLLSLDGRWLLKSPLLERRNLLHTRLVPNRTVQVSDFVEGDGLAFFDAVVSHGLEGMVAKDRHSPYLPGRRSDFWQEVRATQSGEFVIGGYSFGGGRRRDPISSLLLGVYRGKRLEFAGQVSVGCSDREARQLLDLLAPLHSPRCPFAAPPAVPRFIYWCRPDLACHVRYSGWGPDGQLRFPVFVAPRPDIPPEECLREEL